MINKHSLLKIFYVWKMQRIKLLLFIIIFASCSSNKNISYTNYNFKSLNDVPDYSNLDYWAAHPWKHDPSDSLPKALQKNYNPDSTVDIFFLHPTTYGDREMKLGWNAP